MDTHFATSRDGNRIAYDRTGSGPALLLLHGGAQSRQSWRTVGYVDRLKSDFSIVAMDLRGHGESSRPHDVDAYAIERHCEDILAVADHAGVERFILWGYSLGANIGRYLAARSDRVARFVMVGIPFGPGASGEFRHMVTGVRDRWGPIFRAQDEGTLDLQALTPPERGYLQSGRARSEVGWLTAILTWGDVDPGQLLCPTLWMVGSQNPVARDNVETLAPMLPQTRVRPVVIEGLTHESELTDIDRILPRVQGFLGQP